jgi:hypothetical protein
MTTDRATPADTGSATVIEVRGLRKSYGAVSAVAGVDLEVRRGEVFALLGPNGAGKTTTVEILEGYRRRDAGEVRVLGVDPAHGDARWRARLGIVLQGTGEFDELTVGEVVSHFARFYPEPDDPVKVIERVGLTAKRRSRTHTPDRVGVITGGRLGAVGPPAQLGERASAPATVSWLGPDGPQAERTHTPTAFVASLAEQFGGEIPALTVTRPTLEDIYLQLIGAPREEVTQ